MVATTETTCLTCEKPFQVQVRELRRGNGKYCSHRCAGARKREAPAPNLTCAMCQTPFYRKPSAQNGKSGLYFCGRACKDKSQNLTDGIPEVRPSHYGDGRWVKYRKIAFDAHPHRCNNCGWSEYVEVLQVHHKDHDHTNNHPDNLEILCPTHHMVHHYLTGSGLWGRATAAC